MWGMGFRNGWGVRLFRGLLSLFEFKYLMSKSIRSIHRLFIDLLLVH